MTWVQRLKRVFDIEEAKLFGTDVVRMQYLLASKAEGFVNHLPQYLEHLKVINDGVVSLVKERI